MDISKINHLTMYCTKDCNCSLCRELRGFKPIKIPKKPAPRPPSTSIFGRLNENFILRRRGSSSLKTFQPQSLKCSEMCQQRDMGHIYDFCKRQTNTPSPTPVTQAPSSPLSTKDKPVTPPKPNHKVVIYFGDSLAYRTKSYSTDSTKEKEEQVMDKTLKPPTPPPPPPPLPLPPPQCNNQQLQNEVIDMLAPKNDELPPYIESIQNGVINIRIEGNYQCATALVDKVSKPTQALVGKPKDISDNDDVDADEDKDSDNGEAISENCDWSFVQQWRAR